MNSSCSVVIAGLLPRVKLRWRRKITASASGYFDVSTRPISFQNAGKSAGVAGVGSGIVFCCRDSDGSGLSAGGELSGELVANRRGLSLLAQSVGSSVRARCRSVYQEAVARPSSSANLANEILGLVRKNLSSNDMLIGSLLNMVSDSEEMTSRPGPASWLAKAPLPRN